MILFDVGHLERRQIMNWCDEYARVEGYVKLGKSKYWMVCGRLLHMHERPNQEISHEKD